MSRESIVATLLNGIEFDDHRLYDLLDALSSDFYELRNTLLPPQTVSAFGITGQIIGPATVTGFTYTVYDNNLKLTWNSVASLYSYEIRYKAGAGTYADWGTATTVLNTTTLSADINPLTIPLTVGSHTFLIKAIDTAGIYSTLATAFVLVVPAISAPVISQKVISNNVLLSWTTPSTTWKLDHYNVYKDSVLQGQVKGTFEAIFELEGGTYSYQVEAVDILDDVSSLSTAAVAQVGDPSDFILYDTLTSTFTGTKTKCASELVSGVSSLLANIDITKSYQSHFDDNTWTSPQDQVDAGYTRYIEPAEATGSYQEIFDFGTTISNVIIVMDWNETPISGSVSVTTSTLEYSTDGVSYSTPSTGYSVFAPGVRYVRWTMNFAGTGLFYISNLRCILNVHREQDAGSGTAYGADATGTIFTFNKAFLSVDSIDVTPISTTSCKAVVNFTLGSVSPTTFKVLVFDDAGVRLDKDITWIARGVI